MNRFFNISLLTIVLFVGLVSCDETIRKSDINYVARVNNSYLDRYVLEQNIPPQSSPNDSIAMIDAFINKWATKQLLMEAAEFNLSDSKKKEIDELVANFKTELLIKDYLESLVQQKIDTVVNKDNLLDYYNQIKNSFRVEDMLIKLSYVNVLNTNSHYNKIKKWFNGGKNINYDQLDQWSIQMKSYALNDSIWADAFQVSQKLPFINGTNKESYLKNNNYFEVKEENSTYFVYVNKVLRKGDIVPYSYLEPSLRLMVLNNRKMELLKQIEEDILKDAKKDKSYEVYQ